MMFGLQDKILKKIFKINVDCNNKFHPIRNAMDGIGDILTEMEVIDSKSSALLTHISIMFAVLSFFLTTPDNHICVQFALILEFIAYLFIAMILMRCIDIMGPPLRAIPEDDNNELKIIYYFEINLRRTIYQWSVRSTYLLTAILIPIIIAKYFVLGAS